MTKPTDASLKDAEVYFIPIQNRVPLKFGHAVVTSVTCCRALVRIEGRNGQSAAGWGETPLSAQWVWPSALPYETREQLLKEFCLVLGRLWEEHTETGHPMEISHSFLKAALPHALRDFNARRPNLEPMPYLGALVCCSAFDLALHDAYGVLHNTASYETYRAEFMSRDLAHYLTDATGSNAIFKGRYPADFLVYPRPDRLPAWHLVGGKDPIDESELTGLEPQDGYPILLRDWILRDGLRCLKIKLQGNDSAWDWARLLKVGQLAIECGVDWLTADFNCTVTDPAYVNEILDRLLKEHPRIYGMLLYVEQPFPYDLEKHRIDVHSVSARKPLFMDESAHDWEFVKLGRSLGWSGVALKTCKTQTGALLSLCWAKAHGMTLMVQDLTNPMLAQIPHLLLAAHAGTIMGVETNAMQFYPEASRLEAQVHPGIYERRNGEVNLASVTGPGFGYGKATVARELSAAAP